LARAAGTSVTSASAFDPKRIIRDVVEATFVLRIEER
jgi:hypothetical protein